METIKYCKAYFLIKIENDVEAFLDELKIKPSKIIHNGSNYELHFNYVEKYGNISWENISDVLYEVLDGLLDKDTLLASLKEKYNLTFDIPIDTNALDLSKVLILDGPIAVFLYHSTTNKDLSWHYF